MKILILGAGQVGGTLAEHLAREDNEITVIDHDGKRLRELKDRTDIQIVEGKASHPNILRDAGADDADMIIAVTNSDEVNMVACQIAYTLYKTPTKISRIRNMSYLTRKSLFDEGAIPIDVLISPEQIVTNYIKRLIEYPGALQVLDFAEGKVQLVAVKAYYGGPLVGQELRYLREHMPSLDTIVAAIFRKNTPIVPTEQTIIEADDEVFFIAARSHIRTVMSELRRQEHSYKSIMIAGGGNIGERLAEQIESRYRVKIIDHNPERCHQLSESLDRSVVLNGHVANGDLLIQENISDTHVFCALTNDDEANIMASMLAKRLGARKVMTLINNPDYVDLVQGGEIDIAISPAQTTIGSLLTHVRRGDVAVVHSLRRGAAEALEVIVNGNRSTSKVAGRSIAEIRKKLPNGTTLGAVVREEEVFIAHDDFIIEEEDHVILFVINRSNIPIIERLFSVGIGFF